TYFAGGANALAIQADGRIVAAGTRDINAFALARYTTSGLLDKTFGDRGKVTTDVGPGETSANGVAIQTDGRIVAGGVTNVPHEAGDTFVPGMFALARYLRNGMLDRSFSWDGMVRTR